MTPAQTAAMLRIFKKERIDERKRGQKRDFYPETVAERNERIPEKSEYMMQRQKEMYVEYIMF